MSSYLVYLNRTTRVVLAFEREFMATKEPVTIEVNVFDSSPRVDQNRRSRLVPAFWRPNTPCHELGSDDFNEELWLNDGFTLMGTWSLGNSKRTQAMHIGLDNMVGLAESKRLERTQILPGNFPTAKRMWVMFHNVVELDDLPHLGPLFLGAPTKPHFGNWFSS